MDEEQMMMMQGQDPQAEAGRGTDTVMGHLSLGEIVIPRAMQDDPRVMEFLQAAFKAMGADINEFTVGHEANKINPETGYPEFGFFSKAFKYVKNNLKQALPVLAGIYGGPMLSSSLGIGATAGGSLAGAAGGLLSGGGLKSALLGAAAGGIAPNIGSLGGGVAQGPSQIGQIRPTSSGSGILGAVGKATGLTSNSIPSLGGLVGGSGGGSTFGSNMVGQGLSSALGGVAQGDAIKKAQEAQLRAQQQQLANIDTFDPSNITSDAGYQFNLAEGQRGLDRSAAAAGGLQSGRALKEAARYNQQYADNALNSAYGRYADRVGAQNSIYGNIGNVRAQSGLAGAENIAKTASGIFNPQPSIEDLLRLYGRA